MWNPSDYYDNPNYYNVDRTPISTGFYGGNLKEQPTFTRPKGRLFSNNVT